MQEMALPLTVSSVWPRLSLIRRKRFHVILALLSHVSAQAIADLKSFQFRIGAAISDLRPECDAATHSTNHLFECPSHVTQPTLLPSTSGKSLDRSPISFAPSLNSLCCPTQDPARHRDAGIDAGRLACHHTTIPNPAVRLPPVKYYYYYYCNLDSQTVQHLFTRGPIPDSRPLSFLFFPIFNIFMKYSLVNCYKTTTLSLRLETVSVLCDDRLCPLSWFSPSSKLSSSFSCSV